jgi:hypothetical protein
MGNVYTSLWKYSEFGSEAIPLLKVVTSAIIHNVTSGTKKERKKAKEREREQMEKGTYLCHL